MPVSLLVYDSSLRIIPTEVIKFPGGEPHVKITGQRELFYAKRAIVDCRFKSNDDLMATIALTDAARRIGIKDIGLFIPYFPGARQDRVKNFSGEALTCKIYADIINSQGYEAVWVVDPHSDVTPALLNNAKVITQKEILESRLGRYDGIISPDAGSRKKCEDIAEACGLKIYYGAKHRDMATGKLSHFSCDELPVGRYLLTDDICDGGGTFVGLADSIENSLNLGLDLFVTHGIFSKGMDDLLMRYDGIITTDSVYSGPHTDNAEVIELLPIVRNLI